MKINPLISTLLGIPLALTINHSVAKAYARVNHTEAVRPHIIVKVVNKTTPPPATVTTTAIVPKPIPIIYVNGCSNYESTFAKYDWSVDIAMAICQAESNGNIYAVSATNDYGLMQLHNQEIFNPYDNIAAAYKLYLVQGWEAWTTYNSGIYAQFL